MKLTLSVVIPVYNERDQDLQATLSALSAALHRSGWNGPEVVLVDDGSSPPLAPVTLDGADVRIIRQPNLGRFEARRTGIEAARGEYVLLLDSRVTLERSALRWVCERVSAGEEAWNGHCMMANTQSPYARFWNVLTHSAFAEYLDDPRTTSFTLADYDHFPKGTGHFLARKEWLQEAIAGFDSRYADSRFSSDDTHMLRAIAARDRIHISPHFASRYRNREALVPFLRHALHRGTTFYDGFFRRDTRFYWVVVSAFPLSLGGAALVAARPRLAVTALGAGATTAAGFALQRGRPLSEAAAFGVLVPPFAVAFCAGIWRGAWLMTRARGRR